MSVCWIPRQGRSRVRARLQFQGRIVALPPNDQRWAAAQVVDGSGGVLMPGFVDVHVHLREAPESALTDYLRAGITTVRDMNGRPQVLKWRDEIQRGSRLGPRIVAGSPTVANISSPKEGYPTPKTTKQGRALVDGFVRQGYDFIKIYTFLPADAFKGITERALELGVRVAGHAPLAVSFEKLMSSGL